MLLVLPDNVLEIICGFLLPKKRHGVLSSEASTFAKTCRRLWKHLDALAEKELRRMQQKGDHDFLFRVCAQMAAEADADNKSGWRALVVPSNRTRLRSARQTHMYSLGPHAWVSCLALHPDGRTLLVGRHGEEGDPTILSLWDIPSKQRIRCFLGHDCLVSHCRFAAGRVVSHSWEDGTLRIWNMDGTCERSLRLDRGRLALFTERQVLTARQHSRVVDLHNGEVTSNRQLSSFVQFAATDFFQLGSDRLLAFDEDPSDENAARRQLRVLDENSLAEVSCFTHEHAVYYKHVDANDQGKVAALLDTNVSNTGRIDVFGLEGDDLVFRRSFDFIARNNYSLYRSLWGLHGSHVYVSCDSPRRNNEPFGHIHV